MFVEIIKKIVRVAIEKIAKNSEITEEKCPLELAKFLPKGVCTSSENS